MKLSQYAVRTDLALVKQSSLNKIEMGRLVLHVCLVFVLGVVFTQCQHNLDRRSVNDKSLKRVVRQSPQLRIGVLELPPYVIIDKSKDETDQERYTGIAIDVIKKAAADIGFKYNIELQTDELPGQIYANGTSDGLLGRLLKREIDLAGPLHITAARQKVLDFTKPFVSSGISFLVKTPKLYPTSKLMIFQPFSTEVWLLLLIAYIIISILFYTISRVSPYSNVPKRTVSKSNGILSKIADPQAPFSIKNSFMYMINTLTFQGHRETPKSWAARILSIVWALFCLIMILIYAAHLTAWVLLARRQSPTLKFSNIQQLMAASSTRIGIVKDRYEDVAFKTMNNGVRDFTERRGTFVGSYSEGIKWLQESYGNYALAMDTQAAKYVALRHCNFKKFAQPENIAGIGFAIAPGNRVIELSRAILKLHEDGTMTTLLKKWIEEGANCYRDNVDVLPTDVTRELPFSVSVVTVKYVSSPIIFVFVGALVAIVILIAEVVFVRCISKKTEKVEETKLEEGDGDITKEEVVVASP